MARPLEMWSRVVASFAVIVGSRKVFAPTIRPMRILEVFSAHETRVDQPSNMGPFGLPMIGYM
jgi:hypothetical protein